MANSDDFLMISSMFKTLLKGISQDWNKQGYHISITQYKALATLSKNGPQNASQIAAALGITPAAITGITDQLIAEDYVKKERAECDRRVVNITITQKGEEKIKEIHEGQQEVIESYFKVLPDEDIEHLRRIFTQLTSKIDK